MGTLRTMNAVTTDALSDDILYHVLNGSCESDKRPFVPPEYRWAAALVCSRWRGILCAITPTDLAQMHACLHDPLYEMACRVAIENIVSASSMVAMVQRRLSADWVSAWMPTDRYPTTADIMVMLVASGVPDIVSEALDVAKRASVSDKQDYWRRLPPGACWKFSTLCNDTCCGMRKWSDPSACCILLGVMAIHWNDMGALRCVAESHGCMCIETAIACAACHDREDAVGALLPALALAKRPCNRHRANHDMGLAAERLWALVGWHGSLSVANLLVDIEQQRETVTGLEKEERAEFAKVRRGSHGDRGWNWLVYAGLAGRSECLDLCRRRDIGYGCERSALAAAVSGGHIDFYDRLTAYLADTGRRYTVNEIVRECLGMMPNDDIDCIEPGAIEWIVDQPDFEPDDERMLCDLFEYAANGRAYKSGGMLRAAATALRRWPSMCGKVVREVLGVVWHEYLDYGIDDDAITRFIAAAPPHLRQTIKQSLERVRPPAIAIETDQETPGHDHNDNGSTVATIADGTRASKRAKVESKQ